MFIPYLSIQGSEVFLEYETMLHFLAEDKSLDLKDPTLSVYDLSYIFVIPFRSQSSAKRF